MIPTLAKHRLASIAEEWATEVALRVRSVRPDAKGSFAEQFMHYARSENPASMLEIVFYLVLEEIPSGPYFSDARSELADGVPRQLGRAIKHLINETRILAASFATQRAAWPEDSVWLAVELVEDFHAALDWFLPGGFLEGFLMERQRTALQRLAEWMASFTPAGDNWLWSEQGLRDAPEWDRARELAKEALSHFGFGPATSP